jgi:hypothetical protein
MQENGLITSQMESQKCSDKINNYTKEQISDKYECQCEKIIMKKQHTGTKSNQHSLTFIRSNPHPTGNHTTT